MILLPITMVMLLGPYAATLWGLDTILVKQYSGYDPNDDRIHWVSPDILLVEHSIYFNAQIPYMTLINIETNKIHKLIIPDIEPKANCLYNILDVDMAAQMVLFVVFIDAIEGKKIRPSIDKYYLYDVASDRITNLETEAEAIQANPDAYFKEFRYFDTLDYDSNTKRYFVRKEDRYAMIQDVISGKQDRYPYYYERDQYDKEWGLFFIKETYDYCVIPYDGKQLGEKQVIGFNMHGYSKFFLGRYLVGVYAKTMEDMLDIGVEPVAIENLHTNTILQFKNVYSITPNQQMYAVNPQKNLIAVCGFSYSYIDRDYIRAMYLFRYYPKGKINDSRVRYRSGPSTSAEVLGMFEKGERVIILERSAKPMTIGEDTKYWYKVQRSDGKAVWVYGAFLTIVD